MSEADPRLDDERQRIERELQDEIADLDIGDDAEEVIGGSTSSDVNCGPLES